MGGIQVLRRLPGPQVALQDGWQPPTRLPCATCHTGCCWAVQGLTWGSQDEALQQLLARWTTAMPFALMGHVSEEDYPETMFEVKRPH